MTQKSDATLTTDLATTFASSSNITAAELRSQQTDIIDSKANLSVTDALDSGKQDLDADLTALAALSTTGMMARTAAATYALRTITGPAAGISVSDGNGVAGNPTLALANDLAALEGLSSTGIAVRSASDTWVQRAIAGTTDQITVTNGNGVSGNPTIAAVIASQAEAEAGTDTTKLMTPQRVSQAISALGGGGGISNVVEDTSPQLGGALDVNGNAIVSASNGDIAITPNGSGDIVLDGVNWPQADGSSGQVLQTNGSAQASWVTLALSDISDSGALAALSTVGTSEIDDEAVTLAKMQHIATDSFLGRDTAGTGDVEVLSATTARSVLNVEDGATADQSDSEIETAYNNQVSVVSQAEAEAGVATTVRRWTAQRAAQAIAAQSIANLVEDTTPQLGGNLDINGNAIVSTSDGNIAITPNGSGAVVLDGISWPTADGSSGQVLKTNGAGVLTFQDDAGAGGGISNVVEDTTPQLGGDLDVNGNDIVSVSAGDISITPDTTGSIVLDGQNWPQADGSANQYLKTNGSAQLSYATIDDAEVAATGSATNYTPGASTVDGNLSGIDTALGARLQNVVEDTSPQLGGDLDVNGQSIVSASNGDIVITPNGSGDIVLDGQNWPQADGSNGQVLQTNGSGQLSYLTLGALAALSTVDTAQIAADAIDGTKIEDDAVDSEHLAAASVDRPALASRSINAQTGTTYTLALTDENGVVSMSNASANTATIPTNASVAFPVGAQVDLFQLGAGTTTVEGDTGVTVNGVSAGAGDLSAQFAGVTLLKIATNTWVMIGAHDGVS